MVTIGDMMRVDKYVSLINNELNKNWLSTCEKIGNEVLLVRVSGPSKYGFGLHQTEINCSGLLSLMRVRLRQVFRDLNDDVRYAIAKLNPSYRKPYCTKVIQGL